MDELEGKYGFVEAVNVDEYLSSLGVGQVLRKVHRVARPELEITFTESSQMWTIRLESVFHRHVIKAKSGETVDDETFDVRLCKTTLQMSEDKTKITLEQKCEEGPAVTTVIQKLNQDTISIVMTCSGNQATLKFRSAKVLREEREEDGN